MAQEIEPPQYWPNGMRLIEPHQFCVICNKHLYITVAVGFYECEDGHSWSCYDEENEGDVTYDRNQNITIVRKYYANLWHK